jgi:putative transposase
VERKPYSTDLTDEQWSILEPLMPEPRKKGRHREVDLREIVNALLYLLRSGCTWRDLPHDFPRWSTVWGYFRRWKADGTLESLHDRLRDSVREASGKKKEPTAGIVDSQTARTTEKGGRAAMTLARKLKDASAILSLIPLE